jgi:putative membrane protein
MKRLMTLTMVGALAIGAAACADDRDANKVNANGTAAREGGAVGTSGTSADTRFVDEQLAAGRAEVSLGELAQERGTHPDVKSFGAMMVRDHTSAGTELKQIAARTNSSAGNDADHKDDHNELRDELMKLSGNDFDKKYISEMIDDHEKDVKDVEDKAEHADNPDVRAWAAKTLPVMRAHLEKAKAIKERLDQAGDATKGS